MAIPTIYKHPKLSKFSRSAPTMVAPRDLAPSSPIPRSYYVPAMDNVLAPDETHAWSHEERMSWYPIAQVGLILYNRLLNPIWAGFFFPHLLLENVKTKTKQDKAKANSINLRKT